MKPNYNSVDLTEVELVDQYDSVPRGNETQLLAVSIILAETEICTIMTTTMTCFLGVLCIYLHAERVLKMHILRIITNTLQLP